MERYIGCSGWNFKDWKERFYPEGLPQKEWLSYYAEVFGSVEVNATFYRLPKEDTFRKWYDDTPKDFRFALKGSRYVTHLKKLKEVEPYVKDFYEQSALLGDKLGCVLWQLPGNFKKTEKNVEKLEKFLKALPEQVENAIEFRDASWFDDHMRELLAAHKAIPCSISSSFDVPETLEECEGTVYLRFHGKGKERYKYYYGEDELRNWAEAIQAKGVSRLYAYFNNDYYANGPMNGKSFASMLDRKSA